MTLAEKTRKIEEAQQKLKVMPQLNISQDDSTRGRYFCQRISENSEEEPQIYLVNPTNEKLSIPEDCYLRITKTKTLDQIKEDLTLFTQFEEPKKRLNVIDRIVLCDIAEFLKDYTPTTAKGI